MFTEVFQSSFESPTDGFSSLVTRSVAVAHERSAGNFRVMH